MRHVDLAQWAREEQDSTRRAFNQAVHTVLLAIGSTPEISSSMVMKGGILLAIRYNNSRHTRDIDFSTSAKFQEFDQDRFIAQLDAALATASESLDYGLACVIQSAEVKPPRRPDATFPTLTVRVGYAYKDDEASRSKLHAKQLPNVVRIDYSFNEVTQETEIIQLADQVAISVYSFDDLVAEKYRAMIQQETRNRVRRQDVYDLYQLLTGGHAPDGDEKLRILVALKACSASRGIAVERGTLRRPAIKERSLREYHLLQDEISGELPEFEEAFSAVADFYECLPWSGKKG